MPSRLTTNAPSSWANSLMVPRRLGLLMWRTDSGCPNNGSKINDLDLASTASSSPSVNSVPTRLPSRPSRAISTARPMRDSRTSGSYSVTWQRILSNIHQTPPARHQIDFIVSAFCDLEAFLDELLRRFQFYQVLYHSFVIQMLTVGR